MAEKFKPDKKRPFDNRRLFFNSDYDIFNSSHYVESEKKPAAIFECFFWAIFCSLLIFGLWRMGTALNETILAGYEGTTTGIYGSGNRVEKNADGSYSLIVERIVTLTNKKGNEFEISGIELLGGEKGQDASVVIYADQMSFTCYYLDELSGKWIPIDGSSYPIAAKGSIKLMISGRSEGKMLTEEKAQTLYYDFEGVAVTIENYQYYLTTNNNLSRKKIK